MWQRWADGDFTTDVAQSAAIWRAGVQSINLRAVGKQWKDFAKTRVIQHLVYAGNQLPEVIDVSIPAAGWATSSRLG
jgi:hypothetical protein